MSGVNLDIKVVTKSYCPFCDMAKSWLKEHSFEYTEEVIDNEEERLAFYQSINGITEVVGENRNIRRVNSVPQIFIDDERIGGFDSLMDIADDLLKRRSGGGLMQFSETRLQHDMRRHTGLRMNLICQKMLLIGNLVK